MRKLPPYGNRILNAEKTNRDIYLFCGFNAWKKTRELPNRQMMTCLPPWLDPSIYQWPVEGKSVLIFDTGGSDEVYLDKIAYCLHLDGAKEIRAVCQDYTLRVFKGGIK